MIPVSASGINPTLRLVLSIVGSPINTILHIQCQGASVTRRAPPAAPHPEPGPATGAAATTASENTTLSASGTTRSPTRVVASPRQHQPDPKEHYKRDRTQESRRQVTMESPQTVPPRTSAHKQKHAGRQGEGHLGNRPEVIGLDCLRDSPGKQHTCPSLQTSNPLPGLCLTRQASGLE